MKTISARLLLAAGLVAGALALNATAAPPQMGDPSKVTLKTTPVAGSISMIEGVNGFAGGNVAVSVGDDGLFMIDDEIQPMTAKLRAALGALSKKPVRFLVNTHWHGDHTGGNPGVAAMGAVIVAQDNTRKRLSVDQTVEFMGNKMTTPALPAAALPVVTFAEDVTLHVNGDDIHVIHMPPAHTDGDVIVHFTKANVIHTGDVVVGSYPIVDASSGGTIDGMIAAVGKVLALADDATKIIPGHGQVMTKADVAAYQKMLTEVRDRVAKLEAGKKSLDDIKAAKPLADLDERWGQGMIKADFVIEMVTKTLPPAPTMSEKSEKSEKAKPKHKAK
jgi:glyoxylase-like metal-dependent hydrolase (beta-lactamase superfamily II)